MDDKAQRGSTESTQVAAAAVLALVIAWVWADGSVDWRGAAGWLRGLPGPAILAGCAGVTLLLVLRLRVAGPPRSHAVPVRPLSSLVVLIALVAVVGLTLWTARWLVVEASGAKDPISARTDAIRSALAVGAGVAGGITLLFAARRQWLGERAQAHFEVDATEKRVTELYGKAADQLGSDTAPVRLAGLYALERLGNQNENYRQTIIDVICAYLRMPYRHPETPAAQPARHGSRTLGMRRPGEVYRGQDDMARQEELQVRLIAQEILTMRLRPTTRRSEISAWPADRRRGYEKWLVNLAASREYWPNIKLNLAGATLVNFNLMDCRIAGANFEGALFAGTTLFSYTEFTRDAVFRAARFSGEARFLWTAFTGRAIFDEVHFLDDVNFDYADLDAEPFCARFMRTTFEGEASFDQTRFSHMHFDGAVFRKDVTFQMARARGVALTNSTFHGQVTFGGFKSSSRSGVYVAGVRCRPSLVDRLPPGWTTRETSVNSTKHDGTWVEIVVGGVEDQPE